jgi:hypothetical protein
MANVSSKTNAPRKLFANAAVIAATIRDAAKSVPHHVPEEFSAAELSFRGAGVLRGVGEPSAPVRASHSGNFMKRNLAGSCCHPEHTVGISFEGTKMLRYAQCGRRPPVVVVCPTIVQCDFLAAPSAPRPFGFGPWSNLQRPRETAPISCHAKA